jgi:flagellar hook-associated protein 3 FlgL
VTFNAVRDGLDAIHTASDAYATAQWQVASGKRVRVASDDPAAVQQAVNHQDGITRIDGYTKAADSANARLSLIDSTLGDIVTRLTQALTATQSAAGDTASQATRDAASQTIAGLRDSIAGDINTTFNGKYLFGGQQWTAQPYAQVAGVWTYQGDATPVTVNVDESRSVTIALDGQNILKGGDPVDILTTLDGLVTAAQTGNQAVVTAGLDALNRAFSRAVQAQTRVGTDEASITDIQASLVTRRTAASTLLSGDTSVDLADAITRMNQAQVAYQGALGAVSTAGKQSLLDYLR